MLYLWDIIGLGAFVAWLIDYFKRIPFTYRVKSFTDFMGMVGLLFLMWALFALSGPIGAVAHWIWTKIRTNPPPRVPQYHITPVASEMGTTDVKFLDVK